MKSWRTPLLLVLAALIMGCVLFVGLPSRTPLSRAVPDREELVTAAAAGAPAAVPYKIVHIMSYHSPWEWTEMQLDGFQDALKDTPAEYKVFQLNAKQISDKDQLRSRAAEIHAFIEAWQPQLIYTSDDEALQYMAPYLRSLEVPVIFSGVNADLQAYGLEDFPLISGVLEREHFVESVQLLQTAVPHVRRIAAVFDDSPIWDPVIERMKAGLVRLPGVEITAWDRIHTFAEFQQKMAAYPQQAEAVALIGIFGFKDASGQNVPYSEVLKWTVEHSRLPDMSFWKDRALHGTLSGVAVSGYAQGSEAGKMAHGILTEGHSPSDYEVTSTTRGEPILNWARASQLGVSLQPALLDNSQIITRYAWEQ